MRITMLNDTVASPDDGMNRYGYEAGQTYTTSNPLDYATRPLPISEALAAQFVTDGLAKDADAGQESEEVASPEAAAAPVEPAAEASEAPAPVQEQPEPEPAKE